MWVITPEQAVEMYARFCRARFGVANAKRVAEERSAELLEVGDAEGARVWARVKHELDFHYSS